jgi:acetyl/propionyl-CoA carboxylase alpha subunit
MESERVLVGCLGEAAARLLTSLRGAGAETVSLFIATEADAPFVDDADFPVLLPVREGERPFENPAHALSCAMDAGVDSYHPGVQKPALELAHVLSSSGVVWIGPRRDLLTLADDDIERTAREIGLSVLPQSADLSGDALRAAAHRLGPPLILREKDQPPRALQRPDEILGLTTSGRVERLVQGALSVVVPVVGDGVGGSVALPEIQSLRREGILLGRECPASGLSVELRERLAEDAANLVGALRWGGVVGVAFLVAPDGRAWFRSLIRGLPQGWWLSDAVAGVELAIAAMSLAKEEDLGWSQEDVSAETVAIQLCLQATGAGVLEHISLPTEADVQLLRAEGAELEKGSEIAGFLVTAPTHSVALVRAKLLLDAVEVEGVPTNLDNLRQLVTEPGFWGPRLLGAG